MPSARGRLLLPATIFIMRLIPWRLSGALYQPRKVHANRQFWLGTFAADRRLPVFLDNIEYAPGRRLGDSYRGRPPALIEGARGHAVGLFHIAERRSLGGHHQPVHFHPLAATLRPGDVDLAPDGQRIASRRIANRPATPPEGPPHGLRQLVIAGTRRSLDRHHRHDLDV